MLKKLSSIFTRRSAQPSAAQGRNASAKHAVEAPSGRDYWAVSVAPGTKSCAAVQAEKGKRYLVKDAPRVPLADCSMPQDCVCRFRKSTDRRDTDRREIGLSETGRWYAGAEKRKAPRRKTTKT